jgi:hypothetical protein
MKENYIKPQIEIVKLNFENFIFAASTNSSFAKISEHDEAYIFGSRKQ